MVTSLWVEVNKNPKFSHRDIMYALQAKIEIYNVTNKNNLCVCVCVCVCVNNIPCYSLVILEKAGYKALEIHSN